MEVKLFNFMRDTNLNSFVLKLRNLSSTERNSKKSKTNISDGTKDRY